MVGLSKTSTLKEMIVKIDASTVIKYSVKEERIDLDVLRNEKQGLIEQLAYEPTDKELLEYGRANFPLVNKAGIEERIAEIDSILSKVK